jgi:hypothetical protein
MRGTTDREEVDAELRSMAELTYHCFFTLTMPMNSGRTGVRNCYLEISGQCTKAHWRDDQGEW